jgi:glycosyltransferase involved in cell wall biosynthesis
VLFVGFFRHEPNVEAVLFFAREVLPLLRTSGRDVRFRVVGAYPPGSLLELAAADPSIEVTGMVEDIAAHYRRATVFVAPILRGSGTRLKILEAMASGCPVVSTRIGAEGLGATQKEIVLADAPGEMAQAIAQLLSDSRARRELAQSARAFVEQRFDWPIIARRLLAAYGFTLDEGSAPRDLPVAASSESTGSAAGAATPPGYARAAAGSGQ